jgi:hypothetical protein
MMEFINVILICSHGNVAIGHPIECGNTYKSSIIKLNGFITRRTMQFDTNILVIFRSFVLFSEPSYWLLIPIFLKFKNWIPHVQALFDFKTYASLTKIFTTWKLPFLLSLVRSSNSYFIPNWSEIFKMGAKLGTI